MESEPCGCRARQSASSPATSGDVDGGTSLSSEQLLCDDDDDDDEPRREATTTTCCSCAGGGCPCRLDGCGARLERAKSSSRWMVHSGGGGGRCIASEKVQCFCSLSSSLTGDARCQCCKRGRQATRAIISASHAIQCLCGHQCQPCRSCHCAAQLVCVRAASRGWLMRSSKRTREHDYANKREQSQQQHRRRRQECKCERRKQRSRCRHQSVESTAAAAASENLALKPESAARDAKATASATTTSAAPVDKIESEGHAERREHESDKLCNTTSNYELQSQPATTSGHRNQGAGGGGDDCYTIRGGENARCKCAGLIELFEQQVRVCDNDDDDHAQQDDTESKQKQHQHQHSKNRKRQASKSKQANSGGRRADDMRDIITPVKYEPSEESATTSTSCDDSLEPPPPPPDDWAVAGATGGDDRLEDSLEWASRRGARQSTSAGGGKCCCARHKLSMKDASPVERIRSCGAVRVLPRVDNLSASHSAQSRRTTPEKLRKKLTKTHWQPPTDARKYDLSRPNSQNSNSNNQNHNNRQLGRLSTSSPGGNGTFPGPRGAPQVVKHQASSSRRLLKQLAKLRQQQVGVEDSEAPGVRGSSRRRRPESVARIEELIEQLERATREWDEDEHLLDRAERRDFVSQLESRVGSMTASPSGEPTSGYIRQEQEDLLNFGCRQDIPSLEVQLVEKSHERRVPSRDSHSAATVDRRADDLAVRRLRSLATGGGRSPVGTTGGLHSPHTSYLLCANATGSPAPIDFSPNRKHAPLDVERRLREDDLHYRRVTQSRLVTRAAPVSPELPFGIPRNQSTQTLARLSASERLAPDTPTSNSAHFLGKPSCDRHDNIKDNSDHHRQQLSQPKSQPKSPYTTRQQTQTTCTTQRTTSTTTTETRTTQTTTGDTGEKFTPPAHIDQQEMLHDKSVQTTCSTERPAAEPEPPVEVRTTKRSDSRVSFVGDNLKDDEDDDDWRQRRAWVGGRSSADSGLGQASPAPTSHAGTGPSLEYIDGASDPDDLELEIDLVARAPSCESPAPLERHQAELTMTPVRRRPRINIDRPRAKSPLLRVGSIRRKLPAVQLREPPPPQTVVIQTYSDSMKRRLKKSQQQQQQRRRSITEVECQYEFSDDDDDHGEDSNELAQQRARLLVTTYESPESSPHHDDDDGDDEQAASLRLLDRAIESHARLSPRPVQLGGAPPLGIRPRSHGEASPGPRFSLGQYRTLGRRRNLIIL